MLYSEWLWYMPIAAITPMVQCAKVVSMSPQDPNAATNWRKTNQGVSTQDQTCVHHIYNCTLIAVTVVGCTNSVKIQSTPVQKWTRGNVVWLWLLSVMCNDKPVDWKYVTLSLTMCSVNDHYPIALKHWFFFLQLIEAVGDVRKAVNVQPEGYMAEEMFPPPPDFSQLHISGRLSYHGDLKQIETVYEYSRQYHRNGSRWLW